MADTAPPTSRPGRRSRAKGLPVIAVVAVAVAVLVAITATGDDDPSGATGTVSSTERIENTSGGDLVSESSAPESTPVSAPAATDDPPSSTTPAAATTTTNPSAGPGNAPPTTRAATPPPSTITVTAPPTTRAVTPPPSTIVVTAPPTTITVIAPPSATTTIPPVTSVDGCAVLGTDDFGDIQIELTVVNPATTVALLEVGYVLSDGGGGEIVQDFFLLEFMSPGEVARVATETFEPVPPGSDVSSLSCVIDAVEVVDLFDNQLLPGPDDTCSVLGVDDVGDVQLTATVRNSSPEAADLIFTFAVRDLQGVRVISDVGFADGLGAGQVATQEVDTLIPTPPGVDVASLACDIVGLEVF